MNDSELLLGREAMIALGFIHDMLEQQDVVCSCVEGEDAMSYTIPVTVDLDEEDIDVLITINPRYIAVDGPNYELSEDTLPHQSAFHLRSILVEQFYRLIEKEKEFLHGIG